MYVSETNTLRPGFYRHLALKTKPQSVVRRANQILFLLGRQNQPQTLI